LLPAVSITESSSQIESATTAPKKGGLNGDLERVFDKTIITAEPRRTQSLFFNLFSFDPPKIPADRKEGKQITTSLTAIYTCSFYSKTCFYALSYYPDCRSNKTKFASFYSINQKPVRLYMTFSAII